MTETKPIALKGRWKQGFVLDYHTLGSTFLGSDEYGHPVFDTKRTELGELLYRLKYRSDATVVDVISKTAADFFLKWNPGVDIIIPVPPSRSTRAQQPVFILAQALSTHINVPVVDNCIVKTRDTTELKNVYEYDERLRILEGVFSVEPSSVAEKKILIFDDLYRSGATLNAITSTLYDQGKVADVFALAITRTRSRS